MPFLSIWKRRRLIAYRQVVVKTNAIIADTLACALVGSADSKAKVFRDIQLTHFGFGGVPVWGTDQLFSWVGAAMANAYQVYCHGQTCVHEKTSTEPMSVMFPTVMAYADRFGQVPGKGIITALNIGTDVAVLLALAATNEPRFFRSSICGALGAGAALAKLAHMDRPTSSEFLGLIYSQLTGPKLADAAANVGPSLQVAFSLRNVLTAFDLMRQYLAGPVDVFDGPNGYFKVFEPGGNAPPFLDDLGQVWRTAEMSFKPLSLGSSDEPTANEQHRDKFLKCALSAAQPLSSETAERLYARLLALQDEPDASVLSALASGVDLERELL